MRCTRPGCGGTILDGYCDTCGLAARSAAPAVSAAPVASASAQLCARLDCDGTIVDGYCDTCGLAATKPVSVPAQGNGRETSARTSSSVSARGSSRTSTGRTRGSAVSARAMTGRGTNSRGSRTTGRGGLGLGIVDIPSVEYRDPSEAVLVNPEVPEHKRFCSHCGKAVGRGKNGRPGRTAGFCAQCRNAYDFEPKLVAGDVVGGQYEVLGCLAHGGLGWIYLARDNNVSGVWRALKGLLDTGDEAAQAAAMAERQFLAEVEHPNIVKIYNFVQHDTGDYIVMEYVGGKSLKQIALEFKDANAGQSLPLAQVLAFAIEILPAFGYLHSIGLLYNDFKPDNIIQSEEQLKLIDLGAVMAFDDQESDIYSTEGYKAPELETDGPSVESDLFTIGRMLAVLAFDFKGYQREFAHKLPARESVPVLTRFESFDRALRRATHQQRERRFSSAAEMATQLTGVLREVVALERGEQQPAVSTLFTTERYSAGTEGVKSADAPTGVQLAAALPVPLADPADPNAGYLATLGGRADQVVRVLTELRTPTPEVHYRIVRAAVEDGQFELAERHLNRMAGLDAYDWRVIWYRAIVALCQGNPLEARSKFESCYNELPGELAPKLGIAVAAELAGLTSDALRYYQLVWSVDRSYVTAAFALARLRISARDHAGAVDVLGQIPEVAIQRTAAEIAAVRTRLDSPGFADWADPAELARLGERVEALGLDGEAHESLKCEVLAGALSWRLHDETEAADQSLFGARLTEDGLRTALERSYRTRARMAQTRAVRIAMVDCANLVRPRTWV
ncbi:protein kinase [Actinospica durhamensis]|uniref:non-specific serine/threonine protein kinase n=1 Tax=Actinospica durhamensis TaxID=1508375 RepID=A0A941EMW6_9ACTN|nr:serine/threonine-protein kinase [Actinospica durhamensis]MBR7834617.1 protein kinase [Actinospica durhamensis]